MKEMISKIEKHYSWVRVALEGWLIIIGGICLHFLNLDLFTNSLFPDVTLKLPDFGNWKIVDIEFFGSGHFALIDNLNNLLKMLDR